MKYLKTHENVEYYNKVDYVLLNMDVIKQLFNFDNFNIIDDMAKITHVVKNIDRLSLTEYYIDFYNGSNFDIDFVLKKEIIRLLTPEEIEIFNMKKNIYKYNI